MNERTREPRRTAARWRRRIYELLPDLTDDQAVALGREIERMTAESRMLDDTIVEFVGQSVFVSVRPVPGDA